MEGRPFSVEVMLESIPVLLPYLLVTLWVGIASIAAGSFLGALLTWAKLGGGTVLRKLAEIYTYVIRCTPSIVLLFVVFYGLPAFIEAYFDYDINEWSRAAFVIVTFTLLFGGYVSEVFRAAYEAIDHGQYEAAVTVGLSPVQAFFHVMLPQAAVVALPNFGNSVINLLKEGALAYTIGLIDLLGKVNLMISKNYGGYGIEFYLASMVIYWVLNYGLGKFFIWLENHLAHRERKEAAAYGT